MIDLRVTLLVSVMFLKSKKTIKVSTETDPGIYFYGPSWIPVFFYLTKLFYNSEKEEDQEHAPILKRTISLLDDSARNWCRAEQSENEKQLVKIFLQDFVPQVQKYFKVPAKMPSGVVLKKNEILAAFMDFILQIWNIESNRYDDMDDNMDDDMSSLRLQRYESFDLVHKELNFLVTYLGDIPFQHTTHNQLLLNTTLTEFEILANQVGDFTFCYMLGPQQERPTEFGTASKSLRKKVELLLENINQYCITLSKLLPIPVIIDTRVSRPIDSLCIVASLLEDLESLIDRRFDVTIDVGMEGQIVALREGLKLSRAFLENTKMARETKSNCFTTIRDIAYEAEYLINSYVVGKVPIEYLKLRLPSVIQRLELNRSMLQEINTDDDVFQVTNDFIEKLCFQPVETSTNAVDEDHLVGIEESKNEILDKLTRGSKALQVISLIGMPGLGKSTLVKNLFNNSSVRNHFDRRTWCVISQNYERKRVFIEILRTLINDDKKKVLEWGCEELGLMIHKSLKGNRYLIVIDDIWIASTWDDIRIYFPNDNNGSRIMLTSRMKKAAPSESFFPTLPLLSEVDCLNLLVKKVFLNEPCPSQLVGIGSRIAKECKGLPLAVVAIAGVLANLDQNENAWEQVERDFDTFILGSNQGGCMKVLEFSYKHLPDHLKMCFLYLGTYPEDTEIPVKKILRLWIAEGFIQSRKEKSVEDVANEYLHDLMNRSLVSVAKTNFNGGVKACGLHDLLRELCIQKADEENLRNSTKEHFSQCT